MPAAPSSPPAQSPALSPLIAVESSAPAALPAADLPGHLCCQRYRQQGIDLRFHPGRRRQRHRQPTGLLGRGHPGRIGERNSQRVGRSVGAWDLHLGDVFRPYGNRNTIFSLGTTPNGPGRSYSLTTKRDGCVTDRDRHRHRTILVHDRRNSTRGRRWQLAKRHTKFYNDVAPEKARPGALYRNAGRPMWSSVTAAAVEPSRSPDAVTVGAVVSGVPTGSLVFANVNWLRLTRSRPAVRGITLHWSAASPPRPAPISPLRLF